MAQPVRFDMVYHLPAPPERVWPILSDTDRLNRAVGLPPTDSEEKIDTGEPVNVVRALCRLYGMRLELIEEPFEFLEPERYWVRRRIPSGPIREFNGGMRFAPANGGTEVRVESEFVPGNAAGTLLVQGLCAKTRRDMDRLMESVRGHLAGEVEKPFGQGVDLARASESEGTRARLRAASEELRRHPLWSLLADYLTTAGDVELVRMRPFALARRWATDRYETLGLFLRAARDGVLDLSWDLLCPNCRGANQRWERLEEVRDQAHCESCQIRYDANFDRAVEVTFRPNANYRRVEGLIYCAGGPRNTPHVILQTVMSSGEEREVQISLEPGRYRLRNLTGALTLSLFVEADDAAPASSPCDSGRMPEARYSLAPEGIATHGAEILPTGSIALFLENRTATRQQVILERLSLYEESATAAQVTMYQEFRDLFGRELLSPTTQLGIQTLPLLFTDLKGSTSLYSRLGDASAYSLVRDHFDLLRQVVARHGGGIVKTVGDAVMAAFPTAEAGLACALEMRRDLVRFNEDAREPLRVKIGLHQGPCIAVRTYDDRLDYFGGAVNLAARTHGESTGEDVVVTGDILNDPAAAPLLEGVRAEPFDADLRGLGVMRLYRLTMAEDANT